LDGFVVEERAYLVKFVEEISEILEAVQF